MEWDTLWSERHEIEAASGEEGHVSIYSAERREPAAELSFSVNGETYYFSAETFFQANKFLIGELISAAIGGLTGDTALDLYAGVGLFALPLARRFGRVIAVEEHSPAVKFAKKNAYHAGLSNIEVISSSVAGYQADNAKTKTKADLILIDPPRSGTEPGIIDRIAAMRPARIVYVSCEPSILARDLRILLDAGFAIETIKAIDLFPQTHHVETVVRLTLENS
jgi:23S rRNA (uracil1939-C5)-methyltransferase